MWPEFSKNNKHLLITVFTTKIPQRAILQSLIEEMRWQKMNLMTNWKG